MQFKEGSYSVKEDDGQVKAVIVRSGDIAHASSVRCFTRQASARVTKDFVERPDTNASRIVFKPGKLHWALALEIYSVRRHVLV